MDLPTVWTRIDHLERLLAAQAKEIENLRQIITGNHDDRFKSTETKFSNPNRPLSQLPNISDKYLGLGSDPVNNSNDMTGKNLDANFHHYSMNSVVHPSSAIPPIRCSNPPAMDYGSIVTGTTSHEVVIPYMEPHGFELSSDVESTDAIGGRHKQCLIEKTSSAPQSMPDTLTSSLHDKISTSSDQVEAFSLEKPETIDAPLHTAFPVCLNFNQHAQPSLRTCSKSPHNHTLVESKLSKLPELEDGEVYVTIKDGRFKKLVECTPRIEVEKLNIDLPKAATMPIKTGHVFGSSVAKFTPHLKSYKNDIWYQG